MMNKSIFKVVVLSAISIVLFCPNISLAQDAASTEDEDEAFLNPTTGPDETEGSESAAPDDKDEPPDETTDTPEEGEGEGEERTRDHGRQGFVNLLVGTGFFLVAPYDDNKDDENKMCKLKEDGNGDEIEGEPVCTGRSGFHLDMLGGYGVLPGFEVFAIFRLGLEQPSGDGLLNQPKIRQIGAGVKIYSPKDGLFKIGIGVAPLFDFSNHGGGANIGYDFIIHVPIQAQFDFVPWFGAYAQVSPNISFVSEFRLEFTGGIGVQGRFP
ncbi:MAG: hypothetical protein GY854_04785 [Deltaproteobacteria bacterium]|nr:hypothetical protein [Deltaproteobacteria bacterium]